MSDDPVAYEPETAMAEVAAVTHHMPRHWRGRAHTPEVQGELGAMFQLKVGQSAGGGAGHVAEGACVATGASPQT